VETRRQISSPVNSVIKATTTTEMTVSMDLPANVKTHRVVMASYAATALTPNNEECDDDNTNNGDGCDSNCRNEVCGNGITQAGEACDDGNSSNSDGCIDGPGQACSIAVCGDGFLRTVGDDPAQIEECDDGNTDNGDGCNSDCEFEAPCFEVNACPEIEYRELDAGSFIMGDDCFDYISPEY
jgi:cysteine-rich repeat protein